MTAVIHEGDVCDTSRRMASWGIKQALNRCCHFSVASQSLLKCTSAHSKKFFVSYSRNMATCTPSATTAKEEPHLLTSVDEAYRFMTDCLKAAGTPQDHAEIVAKNLLEADYRGHYSHGMNRLSKSLRILKIFKKSLRGSDLANLDFRPALHGH
ncbi:hypothetical protein NQ317_009723 [Molorchus minor]|uniref:Malate dehydrogenase n=1 Tax=Molorchus minor TaxID=1323400 RepID=A0ABQ9JFC1_9CUCU|nr:hypothetical protein NQ317_009723 [Molorchus minor]